MESTCVKLNSEEEEGDSRDHSLATCVPVSPVEERENPISVFLYQTTKGKVINLLAISLALVSRIALWHDDAYGPIASNRHVHSIPYLLLYELALHAVVLIAYATSEMSKSSNWRKTIGFSCSVLLFAVISTDLQWVKLTEIGRLWISHEAIRLQLKTISFLVEEGDTKTRGHSSVRSFVYFLFAPSLVYQLAYQRSDKIRWKRVINSLVWLAITLAVIMPAFYKYLLPHLLINLTEVTWLMFLKKLLIFLPLPFLTYAFLASFIYFEVWCGLFAEFMAFADHRFFGAYVKQRNAGDIFTSLNSVVSNWIKKYLFLPLLKRTRSLLIAYTVTMSLSASYHEIVYCFTLKQFIFMSHILGLAIGPQLLMKTTNRTTRVIQISLFLFGFSTHFYPHVLEYSARLYCPQEESTFIRLVPLHVTCLKRVLFDH